MLSITVLLQYLDKFVFDLLLDRPSNLISYCSMDGLYLGSFVFRQCRGLVVDMLQQQLQERRGSKCFRMPLD